MGHYAFPIAAPRGTLRRPGNFVFGKFGYRTRRKHYRSPRPKISYTRTVRLEMLLTLKLVHIWLKRSTMTSGRLAWALSARIFPPKLALWHAFSRLTTRKLEVCIFEWFKWNKKKLYACLTATKRVWIINLCRIQNTMFVFLQGCLFSQNKRYRSLLYLTHRSWRSLRVSNWHLICRHFLCFFFLLHITPRLYSRRSNWFCRGRCK